MKVKYKIPVINYEEGEIKLTKVEEILFKNKQEIIDVVYMVAERLNIPVAYLTNNAFEFGFASLEEIKEK